MTSKQFTRRRKLLWRTQAAAAEALGVTPGTVSHWEIGRRPVPLIVVKFLDCLEREAPLNEIAEGFVKNIRLSEKLEKIAKGVK